MKNSLVSIIIPTFNRSTLLAKLVDGIMNQTYPFWELIVVDDQSTDQTVELFKDLCSLDDRIRFLVRDREPKGAQTCRNTGLLNARGDYVVILDSDDLISEKCLADRVSYLEANPEIDFGVFPAKTFYEEPDADPRILTDKDHIYGIKEDEVNATAKLLRGEYPFMVWTNMYRRDSITRTHLLFDEKLEAFQDLDFNLAAIARGLKSSFSPQSEFDYYVRYSDRAGSVSSNLNSDNKFNSAKYFMAKTLELISSTPALSPFRNDFWGFFLFYFNRIVGDKMKSAEFMEFCNTHYQGKPFRLRLNYVLSYPFRKQKLFHRIHNAIQYLFFPEYKVRRKFEYSALFNKMIRTQGKRDPAGLRGKSKRSVTLIFILLFILLSLAQFIFLHGEFCQFK